MPKLRLFRDDPLDTDAIPFPRSRAEGFRLRLTDDAVREVENALESVQSRLDEARRLVGAGWDDDGPRAA